MVNAAPIISSFVHNTSSAWINNHERSDIFSSGFRSSWRLRRTGSMMEKRITSTVLVLVWYLWVLED